MVFDYTAQMAMWNLFLLAHTNRGGVRIKAFLVDSKQYYDRLFQPG